MITITRVTTHTELEGIKKLQEENLKKNLGDQEAETEGFVTAEYTNKVSLLHLITASRMWRKTIPVR